MSMDTQPRTSVRMIDDTSFLGLCPKRVEINGAEVLLADTPVEVQMGGGNAPVTVSLTLIVDKLVIEHDNPPAPRSIVHMPTL